MHFDKGKIGSCDVPHVVVPLRGRFKGEQGERCHLLPLANVTASGIEIRAVLNLLIKVKSELNIQSPWGFTNIRGDKLTFQEMNEIILDCIEALKEEDIYNDLGLKDVEIREDYSINISFRRGSSTHA